MTLFIKNYPESVLIVKHIWKSTPCSGERCMICNSYIGVGMGTDFVTSCHSRFDDDKFDRWLEFKNYSMVKSKSKIIRYVRRFSSEVKTRNQLMKIYLQIMKTK